MSGHFDELHGQLHPLEQLQRALHAPSPGTGPTFGVDLAKGPDRSVEFVVHPAGPVPIESDLLSAPTDSRIQIGPLDV